MRSCPRAIVMLTLTLLTAACDAVEPATSGPTSEPAAAGVRGQPAVVHATPQRLSADDLELDTSDLKDPAAADPADAAVGLIIELLAAEGLLVTSIDTHLDSDDNHRVRVQVDVAHSPGHGHPVQSRYLLELARDAGQWRIVTYTEPG